MPAYAIGHLRNVVWGPEIVEYLERIDATLEPYDGRFLIHGARPEVLEGRWSGDLTLVEFPDIERARAWYRSPGYWAILPLLTASAETDMVLLEGVPEGHRATDVLIGAAT